MPISVEDILERFNERKQAADPDLTRMRRVATAYNGEIDIATSEMIRGEEPAAANLIKQGIDQVAMRVASPLPNLVCPPLRPGFDGSERKSKDRRKALLSAWERSDMDMKLRLRARHLLGYATTPVKVCPGPNGPEWKVRNPLNTFPAMTYDEGIWPDDCISVYDRTLGWLEARYPEKMTAVYKGRDAFNRKITPNTSFELLEYTDADENVLVVVGARAPSPDMRPVVMQRAVELERYPNRAGRPLIVCPAAITLDRRISQFDGMLGMFQARARLMALSIIATERGIFQDEWLVARQGEAPQIIQVPNSKLGQVGIVKGGDLTSRPVDPQFTTNQTIDRIEYAERQTGSIPPEFGGSSSTNVRTGRRGAQIMSATVDFFVEEAQILLAKSIQIENRIYIALEKAYNGTEQRSFWLNWKGASGKVDYVPNELWETDENHVTYALAGADTDALVIGAGQRVGMETLSKMRFMEIDPLVPDVEAERDRIRFEGLEQAFMSSIQTQAANPEGPYSPTDLARIAELVRTDQLELFEAVQKVDDEMKEAQAEAAQQGGVDPMAPEAQPGLDRETGAPIGNPEENMPSQENLGRLLLGLRRPQMRLGNEG